MADRREVETGIECHLWRGAGFILIWWSVLEWYRGASDCAVL